MKRETQVWFCPTANCGYRSKPQSLSITQMSHRCGKGQREVFLKPAKKTS